MRVNEDWESMPLNPDMRKYAQAVHDYQMEERKTMIRFAPMLCRCQPRYDWRFPAAPQEECVIHTTIAFDRNGEWMLPGLLHEFPDLAGSLGLPVFGVQVRDDNRVGHLPQPVRHMHARLHDGEYRLVQQDCQSQLDGELNVHLFRVGDQGHDVRGFGHRLDGVPAVVGDEIVPVAHFSFSACLR